MKKINIALLGVGFGGAFVGIYKEHPNVGEIGLYDTDKSAAEKCAEFHGIEKIYDSFSNDPVHVLLVTISMQSMG